MSVPSFSPELVEFLESGVSLLVGTRDSALAPACLHGLGARISADERAVTVYLAASLAGRMLENLANNGQVAVTFSRPIDHRSIQLKGRLISVGPTDEVGRADQERYLASYGAGLLALGFPSFALRRVAWWPSVAVRFTVDSMFEQTPGPRAGTPFAS